MSPPTFVELQQDYQRFQSPATEMAPAFYYVPRVGGVWICGTLHLCGYTILLHTCSSTHVHLGCETVVSCTCTKQCQKVGCEMVQNQGCTTSQRTPAVPVRTKHHDAIRCLCLFVQSCTNAMTHAVVRHEHGVQPCLCVSAQYSAPTDWHGIGAQLEMLTWGLQCGQSLDQKLGDKSSQTVANNSV